MNRLKLTRPVITWYFKNLTCIPDDAKHLYQKHVKSLWSQPNNQGVGMMEMGYQKLWNCV